MTTYDSSNFYISNKDLNILKEYSWELINDLAKQTIDVYRVNKAATTYDSLYGDVTNQADYGYHKWTDVPCFLRVLPPELAREKYGIDHQHGLELFFDRDYVEQLESDNGYVDTLMVREGDYLEYEGTTFEVWRSRYVERVGGLENVPKTVQVDAVSVRTRVFDPSNVNIGSYPKVIRTMGSELEKDYVAEAAELFDIILMSQYSFLTAAAGTSLEAKAVPYFTVWAVPSHYGDPGDEATAPLQRYPYDVSDPEIPINYSGAGGIEAYAYEVNEGRFQEMLDDVEDFLTTYNPHGVFYDDHWNAHDWWTYLWRFAPSEHTSETVHVLTAEEYDTWHEWLEIQTAELMTGTQKVYVNGPQQSNHIRVRRNWEGPGRSYNAMAYVANNMRIGDILQGNIERNDNWSMLCYLGNHTGVSVCCGLADSTSYTESQGWDTDIGYSFDGRINIWLPDEYYDFNQSFERFGYPTLYYE